MDILRIIHVQNVFVFKLVTVFTVTFCAHVILFDANLVCFCPVYTLLPQERWRRFGDLPVCMGRQIVCFLCGHAFHFFMSLFCAYL